MSISNLTNFTITNSTRYLKANNGEMREEGSGKGRDGRKGEEKREEKERR